jgi:hypothetical protein
MRFDRLTVSGGWGKSPVVDMADRQVTPAPWQIVPPAIARLAHELKTDP